MAAYYPPFSANPSFIQGHFGKRGNFELVAGNAYGGLVHIWRYNDDATNYPWKNATTFAASVGQVSGVSLIEGNFGSPGNLEVVVNGAGGILSHFYRQSSDLKWYGPNKISPDTKAIGVPSFIQGTWAKKGNFELVTPVASGGLVHFSRDNDRPSDFPWSPPTHFAQSLGAVTSVSLIQSNYGKHLEVIAIVKSKLIFTFRDDSFKWATPIPIETEYNVTGNPALIQSKFGKQGNFELVVPAASGGLFHFWRDNNDGTKPSPWSKATLFAEDQGVFRGVTLIQSNYGDGNLEVVAEKDGLLFEYVRIGGKWLTTNRVAPS